MCAPDIHARHAVWQQQQACSSSVAQFKCPCVAAAGPSCPPPQAQLPKRRRRLPPNRPAPTRYSLYNAQPSAAPVQSPSVVQYAGVCTTLRAGTGLSSRHGTGMSHHPQHPYLFWLQVVAPLYM